MDAGDETPEKNIQDDFFKSFYKNCKKNNVISIEDFEFYNVKRGLRNADGSGVVAGLTRICNVHGYIIDEGDVCPVEGKLTYRGYDIYDLVNACIEENRHGFEETIYLLLTGELPTESQLEAFNSVLSDFRELPDNFLEDVLIKNPSDNIMNMMARAILYLYAYDLNPEDESMENILLQSIKIIAMMPTIMVNAYQVKRRQYDNKSSYFHPPKTDHSMAESILYALRPDRVFTAEEARLLDICLILHADHGGGNNSSFAARVLSSAGTDTYSAIAAALGSLKGTKHGGANAKVEEMIRYIKDGVSDWEDEAEITEFLEKIMKKEAGDGSGLIYGMGHAIYTLSDPRAVILRENARSIAESKGMAAEFRLLESIEKLAPEVFYKMKGRGKTICANVDLYSGFVYRCLGIPSDLFTPIFAVARVAGWCAHRIEEIYTGGRIIRPAYKSLSENPKYIPISKRK
ncbi:MAG: citrate/2-methylcitrate synthase [Methanosarcinaceae archaeon]|nr:citrate/2-methylcitrate synthase [Methanosarcinaceae archaeon]